MGGSGPQRREKTGEKICGEGGGEDENNERAWPGRVQSEQKSATPHEGERSGRHGSQRTRGSDRSAGRGRAEEEADKKVTETGTRMTLNRKRRAEDDMEEDLPAAKH